MKVWLRWYEYADFMLEWWGDEMSLRKVPFCQHCPLQFDHETPDFREAYGCDCMHLRQHCDCREGVTSSASYYVPLQFIELSEYDNLTGS